MRQLDEEMGTRAIGHAGNVGLILGALATSAPDAVEPPSRAARSSPLGRADTEGRDEVELHFDAGGDRRVLRAAAQRLVDEGLRLR